MPRSKRRKFAWVPFAIPVNSEWRPRVGDSIDTISPAGDPRHRSTLLKAAYLVSPNVPIGPMLLSDFINVAPLTDGQCRALQEQLGAVFIKTSREEIDAAIYRLVATIALSARIPNWRAFRVRLRAIIKSGQDCLRNARQFVQMTDPGSLRNDKPKGALSVDHAVKMHLLLAGLDGCNVNVQINAILETCQRGLDEVEPRASKRGPKVNHLALRRFLQSVESAARSSRGPMALPSDAIREHSGSRATTPLFRFGRECLKLAITNGRAAIVAPQLADVERAHAQQVFDHLDTYTAGNRKSGGAFLSRWRDARANASKK